LNRCIVLTVSPKLTATPPRVPTADIVQISPLRIALLHRTPADGNTFVAANFLYHPINPLLIHLYVFAEFKVLVSAAACAVETGLFASEVYLHYLLIMKSLLYQQLNFKVPPSHCLLIKSSSKLQH
jgi:hypothetical protein